MEDQTFEVLDRYRDGGTRKIKLLDGTELYIDNRIGSETKGKIYDRYPESAAAKIVGELIPEKIKLFDVNKQQSKWRRYRFNTKSIKDYRPLVFNPKYPWWCSGEGYDFAVIIAYLPENEDLTKYWDDAYDITYDERDEITFTDRFPKPSYYEE